MVVMSYTNQPYCDLPECFAGWMARTAPQSGEIYEPRTVQDKLDISANMQHRAARDVRPNQQRGCLVRPDAEGQSALGQQRGRATAAGFSFRFGRCSI